MKLPLPPNTGISPHLNNPIATVNILEHPMSDSIPIHVTDDNTIEYHEQPPYHPTYTQIIKNI